MKVKPMKTAPKRAGIPTMAEAVANPELIAPVRMRRGIGAALGTSLVGSLLAGAAGCSRETTPPPVAALDADRAASDADAAALAEAARQSAATLVAPMLQKALDEDGRGAFGCVAVDPPACLSENEALNLIEQEFAKAGVKLRDCYELSGFTQTRTDWKAERKPKGKEEEDEWRFGLSGDGDPARPRKHVPGNWLFDLATEDGSLLVEFLSLHDHEKLEDKDPRMWSTARSYDLLRRAARFREDLATRTNGAPVTVALFFDPLASAFTWADREMVPRPGSRFEKMSEEEIEAMDWQKRRELLTLDALDKLREQVRFFLDWAKKEGKLPAQ